MLSKSALVSMPYNIILLQNKAVCLSKKSFFLMRKHLYNRSLLSLCPSQPHLLSFWPALASHTCSIGPHRHVFWTWINPSIDVLITQLSFKSNVSWEMFWHQFVSSFSLILKKNSYLRVEKHFQNNIDRKTYHNKSRKAQRKFN